MASKWNLPPSGSMDKANGIYYQNMNMQELAERRKKNDLIIIPIGATETHGPGQALGEDTFMVARYAEEVARVTGCTVAQPLWYGTHPYHHLGMPGTIVIPDDIFIGYIEAMIAGFWNAGFRKQILLNGHGQEWVIPGAIHNFTKKYQVPAVLTEVHWWYATGGNMKTKAQGGVYDTPLYHACEVECSYLMALAPEMVEKENLIDVEITGTYINPEGHFAGPSSLENPPPLRYWMHEGLVRNYEAQMYPEGSLGPSTRASAEKARPGVESVLDYLEKLVNDIMAAFPPGKLPPLEEFTQRRGEAIDAVMKEPGTKGWRNLYTIGWPP